MSKLKNAKSLAEPERTLIMLKQIAWNTFKSTGNIDTLLELLKVDETINEVNKRDGLNPINREVIQKLNSNNDLDKNIKL